MKPLKLKIEGLNSYIEPQIIDFEKLTERGLFGIFGPTGSGKSTILDAITIAMYGKIARNTSGFINSQRDNAKISYEFEIGRGIDRKKYIIDRNIKRNEKTGGFKNTSTRLRELKADNTFEVITDKPSELNKKITEIVGLTSEDFTRSVVLPQGKFNDFLKLTGIERRNMLERIFNLEKYGKKLVQKIRSAKNKKAAEKTELNGKLSSYTDVSEEALKELEANLNILLNEEKALKLQKNDIENKINTYKNIIDKQNELKKYNERKKILENRLDEIKLNKVKIEKAEKALVIKPYIDEINEVNNILNSNKSELAIVNENALEIDKEFNNIQSKYEIAIKKKIEEVPKLLGQEKNYNDALKYKIENNELTKFIETNKIKYNKYKQETENLSNKLNNISKDKESIIKKINEMQNKIDDIKVDPDYRDTVQKAYEIEKEFFDYREQKELKEKDLMNLQNNIKTKSNEFNNLLLKKNQLNEKFDNVKHRKAELQNNKPGDNNDLLDLRENINELRNIKNEIEKGNETIGKVEVALTENNNKKIEIEKNIIILTEEINEKKIMLHEINKEIEDLKIKNIAATLSSNIKENEPCPLCGSLHHPNPILDRNDDELKQKIDEESNLNKEIEVIQNKLKTVEGESSKFKVENEYLNKNIDDLTKTLPKDDIEKISLELNNAVKSFNELRSNIDKWNKEEKEVTENFNKLSEVNNKYEIKIATIKEGLNKDKELYEKLKIELQKITTRLDETENKYIDYKENLKLNNIKEKLISITNNERLINNLRKEMSTNNDYKNNLENQYTNYYNEINNIKINLAKLHEIINGKNIIIEKNNAKIFELCENNDPELHLNYVRNEIKKINKNEEELKIKLSNISTEKENINKRKIALTESVKTTEKRHNDILIKVDRMLAKNDFITKAEVYNSIIEANLLKNLKDEIKAFEEEIININSNINRLESIVKDKIIDEDTWKNINDKNEEISKKLSEKAKEIGAVNQKHKDISKDLKIVKELNKSLKEVTKKYDLLETLDKLVQGNKFVEFIAISQLKYIVIEASKRLKEITRGRYALELDSTGNFIMRDDFNGGTRRTTDTLSGGETFLTSLSLALSLSSQIQLKGSAPLEFFFLDEGFGTLDNNLLDIVISSLEKLHSDNLSVGLISHVDELKNRVPVKLIVNPPEVGEEGSKVKLEYS